MKTGRRALALCLLLLLAGCAKRDARIASATVRTPDGGETVQTWQYDEKGRLTAMEGPDGTAAFDYDMDYDPPAPDEDAPDFAPPEPTAFGGALDNVAAARLRAPDGRTELYAYGRLMACYRADGSLLRSYLRAENGLLTQVRYFDASGALEKTEEYRYIGDDYGTAMEADIFVDGAETGYIGYDYDLGKHLVKATYYNPDETARAATAYTWEDGRVLRTTQYEGASTLAYSVTYAYE